jgi:hypothetical protein
MVSEVKGKTLTSVLQTWKDLSRPLDLIYCTVRKLEEISAEL